MGKNNQPGVLCTELLLLEEDEEYGFVGAKFFAPYVTAYSKQVYELHDLINDIGSRNNNESMIFKASLYEISNIHDANLACSMVKKCFDYNSKSFRIYIKNSALTIEEIKYMADTVLAISKEYDIETDAVLSVVSMEWELEKIFRP